jgi:hypothetical protein
MQRTVMAMAAMGSAFGLGAAMPASAQSILDVRDTTARQEQLRSTANIGGTVKSEARISRTFRLRVDTQVTTLPGADGQNRIHPRLARSMIDLFPIPDEGFRLSAGNRFVARRVAGDSRGLLYTPRGASNGVMRTGLRRFNPAVTVGYQGEVAPKVSLGVEVGALKGHAWQRVRTDGAMPRGLRERERNPVASLVNVDATVKF